MLILSKNLVAKENFLVKLHICNPFDFDMKIDFYPLIYWFKSFLVCFTSYKSSDMFIFSSQHTSAWREMLKNQHQRFEVTTFCL